MKTNSFEITNQMIKESIYDILYYGSDEKITAKKIRDNINNNLLLMLSTNQNSLFDKDTYKLLINKGGYTEEDLEIIVNHFLYIINKAKHRKQGKVICDNCGNEFEKPISEIKRNKELGRKNYCSRKCHGVSNIKNLKR